MSANNAETVFQAVTRALESGCPVEHIDRAIRDAGRPSPSMRNPAYSLASRQVDLLLRDRDELRAALQALVDLKDGPRDDYYRDAKPRAWERARGALRNT